MEEAVCRHGMIPHLPGFNKDIGMPPPALMFVHKCR